MAEVIRRLACGDATKAMREIQDEIAKRPPATWDLSVSHDDGCLCLEGQSIHWCNCSPDIVATKISE